MFQCLSRSLGRILDKRSRPDQRRFWAMFTVVALTLGSLALTPWTAQAEEPGDIFAEAWQRVRDIGAYEFSANIMPYLHFCPRLAHPKGHQAATQGSTN